VLIPATEKVSRKAQLAGFGSFSAWFLDGNLQFRI